VALKPIAAKLTVVVLPLLVLDALPTSSSNSALLVVPDVLDVPEALFELPDVLLELPELELPPVMAFSSCCSSEVLEELSELLSAW
jgi:hypothetical protein